MSHKELQMPLGIWHIRNIDSWRFAGTRVPPSLKLSTISISLQQLVPQQQKKLKLIETWFKILSISLEPGFISISDLNKAMRMFDSHRFGGTHKEFVYLGGIKNVHNFLSVCWVMLSKTLLICIIFFYDIVLKFLNILVHRWRKAVE